MTHDILKRSLSRASCPAIPSSRCLAKAPRGQVAQLRQALGLALPLEVQHGHYL